jgi:hypothetical protein
MHTRAWRTQYAVAAKTKEMEAKLETHTCSNSGTRTDSIAAGSSIRRQASTSAHHPAGMRTPSKHQAARIRQGHESKHACVFV